MTTDNDTDDRSEAERYNDRRRLMGTYNPDTWDPQETPDAGTVNLDVSGTVGPDYLGQETVDVKGHSHDRPADMDMLHARRLALQGEFDDLDDDQPLPLLDSDMRTDPTEGTQGSWKKVSRISGDGCPECGSQFEVRYMASTLGDVGGSYCLLCEADIVEP